jgi:hypothetical protein
MRYRRGPFARSISRRMPASHRGLRGARDAPDVARSFRGCEREGERLSSSAGSAAGDPAGPPRQFCVEPDSHRHGDYSDVVPGRHDARGRDAGRSLLGAISTYRRNEPAASFTALGRVPRERRGVSYFLFRAGLLSSVGRVREAEAALTEVGQADPKSGRSPPCAPASRWCATLRTRCCVWPIQGPSGKTIPRGKRCPPAGIPSDVYP